MANTDVKWCVDGQIIDACDLCKFPSHDGTCESSIVSRKKDNKILTLNTCCDYCMEELKEFRRESLILRYSARNVFKLTFEKRIPIFHKLEPIDFVNVCFFKGLSQDRIMKRFQSPEFYFESDIRQEFSVFKSFKNMSPSGQQLWMSMFGNFDASTGLFCLNVFQRNSPHIFAHQLAYFLSAVDVEDRAMFLAMFLTENRISYIVSKQDLHNLCMLIPYMGLDKIEMILEKNYPTSIVAAFCLFAVRKHREHKLSLIFSDNQVRKLARKLGLPYISSNSSPIIFSINVFCPFEFMQSIKEFNTKGGKTPLSAMEHQRVCASAQLNYKIEMNPHSIEVSIYIRNVRCHVAFIPSDDYYYYNRKNREVEPGKEKHFPSKIRIRVEPSEECKMGTQSLTIGKSSNDASRTFSQEDYWEAGIQIPKGPAELKAGKKAGSSSELSNWRFEMDECSDNDNVGYFDWTLFDNANGVGVWNADSKNYRKLMDPKSSLRNRGNHMSSPFNSNGGCVFGEDLYGKPLTWSLDRKLEGTTSSWTVHIDVWLTYCFNVTRNNCYHTLHSSFPASVEMKLQ